MYLFLCLQQLDLNLPLFFNHVFKELRLKFGDYVSPKEILHDLEEDVVEVDAALLVADKISYLIINFYYNNYVIKFMFRTLIAISFLLSSCCSGIF